MKIMYYCQHVLGIGHFFRSMEVAKAFTGHQVLFVEGGDPLPGYRAPDHIRRIFLPPLMMDEQFSRVESHGRMLARVQDERKQKLMDTFRDFSPDALIIELFPFGRKYFRFELLPILDYNLQQGRKTLMVCSLRDILVEKDDPDSYEKKVLDLLERYFDLVLVHSDPNLVRLEDTFSHPDRIAVPMHYTGYVARRAEQPGPERIPKSIVASSGGGKVGTDLLQAALEAVAQIDDPQLGLRVFTGPFMEPADRTALAQLAGGDRRVSLLPFSPTFQDQLASAELSISMAGYNTTMDILAAGTRAIVYPFPQNREQALRARRLEALGLVRVLDRPDPRELKPLIEAFLQHGATNPRPHHLDLNGAACSVRLVEKYLQNNYVMRT